MQAERLLREGKLQAALDALQEQVRSAPADAKLRIFLFQLLAVLGQWERALKQLQAAAGLSADALPMAQAYRELIVCEMLRAQVFAGRATPLLIGQPEEWLALQVEALRASAEGARERAQELRTEALTKAPRTSASSEGHHFEALLDGDSRLGPVLEVILNGRYAWIPFAHVQELVLEKPTDLRDLVWLPGQLTLRGAAPSVCFVPTRYPGTEQSADDALRLARKTEWLEQGGDTYYGVGQRTWLADQDLLAQLDVRQLVFAAPATESQVRSSHG